MKIKTNMEKTDYVLVNCPLGELTQLVEKLENNFQLKLVREPSLALTMIRAEDSVEQQEFYLGEALVTDCEVSLDETITGYGICIGDEPQRAYCIAVVDALLQSGQSIPGLTEFLSKHEALLNMAETIEYNQIQRARVDFKMMEQA